MKSLITIYTLGFIVGMQVYFASLNYNYGLAAWCACCCLAFVGRHNE